MCRVPYLFQDTLVLRKMTISQNIKPDSEWFFFNGGPGAPRYGDDPTKHAVDHDTETFVREVLQNANDQKLHDERPVHVTFRFVTLSGDERRDFLEALRWGDGLRERLETIAASDQGRGYEQLLDQVDDPDEEIRLLIVEDRNTTGLTGGWDDDSNYAALVRDELYSSKQDDTAGGSYGLGKSVLWTFSGASTVIFNSHPASSDSETLAQRLIGRTKLPTHELAGDETTYQGAGWLCQPNRTDEGVRPEALTGDTAANLATDLNISRPAVSGTSAMVVEFRDPTRETRPDLEDLADEFVEAAVKYFWPAIYRGDLNVTVETPDQTMEADVDSVPSIKPFVECFERRFSNEKRSLSTPGDVAGLDIPMNIPSRADGSKTPDGTVRLATRLASPADNDTYLNRVALFRGSGMVVKYLDQSRVAFADRNFHGVLACGEARTDDEPTDSDREIDRFLRFAEPPDHDEWESTENLREEYQRGFRMAIDDMFGTVRDGLRHLIAESDASESMLSEQVLKRFPIHGRGKPRVDKTRVRVFEFESSCRFDGSCWQFEGEITPLVDDYEGWSAEVALTGIGEDGSSYDAVPIESIRLEEEALTSTIEDGEAHISVEGNIGELRFEGQSHEIGAHDVSSGTVGETRLEIRAEIRTTEGDET